MSTLLSGGTCAWHIIVLDVFYKIEDYCRCIDISALIKDFMYKNRFGATNIFVLIARQIYHITHDVDSTW